MEFGLRWLGINTIRHSNGQVSHYAQCSEVHEAWNIKKILNTHHKDSTLFYSKVFFTIKYVNGNGLIATHRRKEIFVALWAIQLFSVCMIITFTFFTWRFFLFKNILKRESPIRNWSIYGSHIFMVTLVWISWYKYQSRHLAS